MRSRLLGIAVYSWVLLGLISGSSLQPLRAGTQQWTQTLFQTTHHDFGTVSRNVKAEYAFTLTNPFESDLHIAAVRSSCGCTKPIAAKNVIRAGETGEIVAQLNTRSFIGVKTAVITVVIDRPNYAEIQLTVQGNIRSDIVTEPGEIRFGDVDAGETREVVVRISYAGRNDWSITDVRGSSEHLEVRMDPIVRNGRNLTAQLRVRLKSTAAVGELVDELTVVTNDPQSGSFNLPVSVRIMPPVAVTPKYVSLGPVSKGAKVRQRFVVRGKTPFAIQAIECTDSRFSFTLPEGKKPMHVVPLEFDGSEGEGSFRQWVTIVTDLGERLSAEVEIGGEIVQ